MAPSIHDELATHYSGSKAEKCRSWTMHVLLKLHSGIATVFAKGQIVFHVSVMVEDH